ncbi:MAG: acyltransferase [Myxococcota bacterium]
MSAEKPRQKLAFIDGLRAVAALTIVAHHLAFYGPLSDRAHQLAPGPIAFLFEYGRYAVQIFLVVGGFVMARHLATLPRLRLPEIGAELWARYRRIGLPYLAALVLAIIANELARLFMDDASISAPPTALQLLAHATFTTHIFGFEALTAGIWYLGIDFQIVVLLVLLLALAQRLRPQDPQPILMAMSAALAALSLFWLGRIPALDIWAPYFFASTFLGMAVEWLRKGTLPAWTVGLIGAALVLAELQQFRLRLFVSGTTAILLWAATRWPALGTFPAQRGVQYLGQTSYALFLVHFPVCLLINAVAMRFFDPTPASAWAWMGLAMALSVLAAAVFHAQVETRILRPRAAQAEPRISLPADA